MTTRATTFPSYPATATRLPWGRSCTQPATLEISSTLLYFSGMDASEFNSPGEIAKLIVRQRGLNNVPGDEWVYSNTNYSALELPFGHAPVQTKLGIS
jgi:hypothetical protein